MSNSGIVVMLMVSGNNNDSCSDGKIIVKVVMKVKVILEVMVMGILTLRNCGEF